MTFKEIYELGENMLDLLDTLDALLNMRILVLKEDGMFRYIGNEFHDSYVRISESLYNYLKNRRN